MTVALERRCETCAQLLTYGRSDKRFCSTACRVAAHRARRALTWRASARFLEATFPERWAEPRGDDPFAEVDELVQRRREKLGR
jgi:hypothetical protein